MIKAKQSKATSKPLTVARQIDRQTTKTKIYSFYNLIASKDVIFYKIEFYRFFSKDTYKRYMYIFCKRKYTTKINITLLDFTLLV